MKTNTIKKILAGFMTVLLATQMHIIASATGETPTFPDVPKNAWFFTPVEQAVSNGFVSGYPGGTFGPNDSVTYAQFSVMLTRGFFQDKVKVYSGGTDPWFLPYTSTANSLGLFNGTNIDGSGYTNKDLVGQNLNRYEMAQMLYNTLKAVDINNDVDLPSVIAKTEDWSSIPEKYCEAVATVKTAGIISGINAAGRFDGEGLMSRAQACVVMVAIDNTIKGPQQTYTWSNGITYTGAISNGEAHGYGEMTFPGVGTYKGNFVNGRREGTGTFTWLVGDKYVGQWNRDKQNGSGTYTFADGFVIRGTWADNQIAASTFYMMPSTAVSTVGEKIELVARVEPDVITDTIKWSTSSNIVSIEYKNNYCIVTANSTGNVIVSAETASGKKATCSIQISDNQVPLRELRLSKGDAILSVNDTFTLKATTSPSNATNSSITWSSSDPAVARVSSSGVVTAKAEGTAIISAKAASGLVATCYVTVTDPNSALWDGSWALYESNSSGKKTYNYITNGSCTIDERTMTATLKIDYVSTLYCNLSQVNSYTLSSTVEHDYSGAYHLTFTSIDDKTIILEAEKTSTYGLVSTTYYVLEKQS